MLVFMFVAMAAFVFVFMAVLVHVLVSMPVLMLMSVLVICIVHFALPLWRLTTAYQCGMPAWKGEKP